MIYYLVGIFDQVSYEYMESIQKSLCTKYNLYSENTTLPKLHITLETITDPSIDNLDVSLKNVFKDYTKFKVDLNGVVCFDQDRKSVV